MSNLTKYALRTILSFAMILLVFSVYQSSAFARESKYTRQGTGPLYWSTYEYQYTKNKPMSETEWKKNIDWIAQEYKSFGYHMVVTDGWIESSQQTNENGYIISHNDQWEHDWRYWSTYTNEKGLDLGVYYNPLWVTRSAANDPTKFVVGTKYRLKDIVTAGDQFNSDLYWVDITKPGAKEYIQGYIQYFKNMGVPYLRIDFLSWYENGIDKGNTIGVNHGEVKYRTVLNWMDEAAGDEMELSLVMPHLFRHAENESRYGDMIRINEDLAKGGWQNLSGQRQNWLESWSQWANPFTGFTGFSDIAGRGSSLILDGDFIRMNTFNNDYERETIINLFTMAGSPIAITDQYSTIGPYGKFYQNKNMLDLNQTGFVGKPYYYSSTPFSQDASARDTEKWLGQRPDGSWIIGLFNRSDGQSVKSIDYINDLGLSGSASTSDLWTNENLGLISQYSPTLQPHASKVVSIKPIGNRVRYQAEVATWISSVNFNNNHKNYQGFGFVDHLDNPGAKIVFAVQVPTDGTYDVTLRYGNATNNTSSMHISAQNDKGTVVQPSKQVIFPNLPDWSTWANQSVQVTLQKGVNLVTLEYNSSDQGAILLDYMELNRDNSSNQVSAYVVNNGFETGNLSGWYQVHPKAQKPSYGVDTHNENHGKYKAYLWSQFAFKQSIHQVISGLNTGIYQIRAIVKNRNYHSSQPKIARMELTSYGGKPVYVNIPPSKTYTSIKTNINIMQGKVDIGFNLESPGMSSLQIDQIFITKLK